MAGGGYPFSANGVRHGNDHGQPGGSPAFTIAVTPDMCAEIAACSGRQTKRGPVYIWHAPIDDYAETAVDIATDFIPGVAQAKTAYDAYQRIQNGEDPVDVLMAAGGDAVLGLIPGLKAGKKAVGKALDKVEDVADAAGDVQRASNALPLPKPGSANPSGAGKPFPQKVKEQAREESGNRCVFCGTGTTAKPGPTKSEIDHSIPKSRGGDNSFDNAQNTCRTCNRRKSAKTTEEFLE